MATIGRMVARLDLDHRNFSRNLHSSRMSLASFAKSAIGRMAAVSGAFIGVSSAIGAVAKSLRGAMDAEQAQVSFSVLIGSAEDATRVLKDLEQFAAKTPFQLPELRNATRLMLAFGFSSNAVLDELRMLGDVASGISQPIGDIAEIYGKARVQGRLFAEDINQLTGRGIPVIQELAKQFGVVDSEVRKLVEQGLVNFSHLRQAFVNMTSDGGKFAGMMAAQSDTLAGKLSTLADNVNAAFREIGKVLVEEIDFKGAMEAATQFIQQEIPKIAQRLRELLQLMDRIESFSRSAEESRFNPINIGRRASEGFKGWLQNTGGNVPVTLGATGFQQQQSMMGQLMSVGEARAMLQQAADSQAHMADMAEEFYKRQPGQIQDNMARMAEQFQQRRAADMRQQMTGDLASRFMGSLTSTVFPAISNYLIDRMGGPEAESRGPQFAAALERGSSEAFSAIMRAMGRGDKSEQYQKQTAEKAKEMAKALNKMVQQNARNPGYPAIVDSF